MCVFCQRRIKVYYTGLLLYFLWSFSPDPSSGLALRSVFDYFFIFGIIVLQKISVSTFFQFFTQSIYDVVIDG